MTRRSAAPILQAQPAPWESCVSEVGVLPVMKRHPTTDSLIRWIGMSTSNPGRESETARRLRELPAVDQLVSAIEQDSQIDHEWALRAARDVLAERRTGLESGTDLRGVDGIVAAATERAERLSRPSLRRVVNATGVVLHTNLGRAPMATEAADAVAGIATGYSTLEFDLETGQRGSRRDHVESLLCELTGAEAALAVNNNAAAVTLSLAATCAGREVIVSRGELVEIGGSFRVPEILEQSGARLVEVGTTNRTRTEDYERAIDPDTAAILRVHQSNFRTVGFTEMADTVGLAALTSEKGILLVEDLGSGAMTAIEDEPTIRNSITSGVDLVCASADKLLGGPQAGIIAGNQKAVDACAKHPLARAVRIDKLQLAALETTLRIYASQGPDAVPAVAMLRATGEELRGHATDIAETIGSAATVAIGVSAAGGGSLPATEFEGPVCLIDPSPTSCENLVAALRDRDLPIIACISEDRVVIDPRTLLPGEIDLVGQSVKESLGRK